MVERFLGKEEVGSSTLLIGSIIRKLIIFLNYLLFKVTIILQLINLILLLSLFLYLFQQFLGIYTFFYQKQMELTKIVLFW